MRMIRRAFAACILVVNFRQGMLSAAFILPTAVIGVSRNQRAGAKVRHDIDGLVESMGLTPVKRSKIMGRKKTKTRKEENSSLANKKDPTIMSGEEKQKVSTASGDTQPSKNNEDESNPSSSTPTQKQSPSTLHETRDISLQTQLDYSRQGHTSIRNFIPAEIIHQVYRDLKAYSKDEKIAQEKGESSSPFLQFFNTWRDVPSIRRLATSPLLCHAAATMLNLPVSETGVRLRLYQDSAFIKRNKDGITPWHIDGRMIPLDTSHVITFWIPLQPIPSIENGGTALLFINKSHSDFALPYWSGRGTEYGANDGSKYNAYDHLATRYGIENVDDNRIVDNNKGAIDHHMPMNVGDCTVHSGWTMHCANGNENSGYARTRYAIAITYVDSYAEVRKDIPGVGQNVSVKRSKGNRKKPSGPKTTFLGDGEDSSSYTDWIGDVLPRTRFEHELVPDVWPSSTRSN
jgi:ectoine hydroxylase-related dioxygenase (phytanoyl-CoA dioxygenase family)